MGPTAAKVGTTLWFTVMVTTAVVAHKPTVGVKVQDVVAVLSNAGDQLPVIPLVEVVGKADKVLPEQIGATDANAGTAF